MEISGGETGTGVLNIEAENEGLDSELHLTVNGGVINIRSGDDGINTNEDGVSVTTINGGVVNIVAGLGSEGDGIDSNGYLVINGGTVLASANPAADSGLDSDCGSYINATAGRSPSICSLPRHRAPTKPSLSRTPTAGCFSPMIPTGMSCSATLAAATAAPSSAAPPLRWGKATTFMSAAI